MLTNRLVCKAPLMNFGCAPDITESFRLSDEIELVTPCIVRVGDVIADFAGPRVLEENHWRPWGLRCEIRISKEEMRGSAHDQVRDLIEKALFALWITRPNDGHYTHTFTFDGDDTEATGVTDYHERKYCHRRHIRGEPTHNELDEAKSILAGIRHAYQANSRLSSTLNYLLTALHLRFEDVRYVMFCIVLENLFSTDDRELSHKLAERVARFLRTEPQNQKSLFERVKKIYSLRSKIVHGTERPMEKDKSSEELGGDLEEFAQQSLKRILLDSRLTELFNGGRKTKESFFTELLFPLKG